MQTNPQDLVVPIKYVGPKDEKHDAVNHTGTIWKKGQTLIYPARLAKALLVHTDVWRIGKREDVKDTSDDAAAVAGTMAGGVPESTGASGQGREGTVKSGREDPPVRDQAKDRQESAKGSRRTLE